MAMIYLKIRAGVGKLDETYVSGRIRAILMEAGAPDSRVSGSLFMDYRIMGIPEDRLDAAHSLMQNEPGFEPTAARKTPALPGAEPLNNPPGLYKP
jgi:hypothetical protein